GLDVLRQAIAELLGEDVFVGTLRLPPRLGRLRAQLFELGAGQSEAPDEEGCTLLQVRQPPAELNRRARRAGWPPAE
ncbi:GTPase HflX, partial [Pseudomonas aeruginosa]|nr:GTPase HflX [Pseudomonas aeruginosa]